MANFESLLVDIEGVFQGKDLTERIHHLTSKLGDTFVTRFLEYTAERKATLRLSNIGRPDRQLWYELRDYPKEKLSSTVKFKFLFGSILEELILFLAKEAGHEVSCEQREVSVDGVIGHIDAIIDGVLVDVKSCSTRSFEKFEKGTLFSDDPFGYVGQLSGYAKALKVERAAFVAIDKTLGKICILILPQEAIESYNVSARIAKVRETIKSPIPPKRCYDPKPISKTDKSGNLVLSTGCNYCAYKIECWKDSNEGKGLLLRHYSSGPKWFTKIVKEPKLKYEGEYESFPTRD